MRHDKKGAVQAALVLDTVGGVYHRGAIILRLLILRDSFHRGAGGFAEEASVRDRHQSCGTHVRSDSQIQSRGHATRGSSASLQWLVNASTVHPTRVCLMISLPPPRELCWRTGAFSPSTARGLQVMELMRQSGRRQDSVPAVPLRCGTLV